ncbi:ABC transporter ATP-binding protein [Ralstonia pseudosolanacearum]|uniref:ATP-binding cassette domain-containing protein n=1 Tax=Ralstonia pseudosolanacearum TaxID=1310165 RepID=UPI003CF67A46
MQNAEWPASPVSEPQGNRRRHMEWSTASRPAVIYGHRVAWISIALIVMHQSLVAASTVFLTQAIERFQVGGDYLPFLYLYLAAMTLPYIPGCGSFVFLQRWINDAHHAFVSQLSERIRGKVAQYCNVSQRERVTATLARNSLPVLREYITFIHDLVSFTLNSSLSMAVIIFLLPSRLALGYITSFMLCLGFIFLLRKTIAASSSDYEIRYLTYTDSLNKAWDNVALGNSYNETIWRRRKEEAGRNFYNAAIALQIRKQLGNLLLAGASLLPTTFLIVMIFRDGRASAPVVAAVVVNLTRIFLILNSLSALVYKVLDFSAMRAKLEVLFAPVSTPLDGGSASADHVGTIYVNGSEIQGRSQVIDYVSNVEHGRIRITGPNGSGKSSALLALKEQFGNRCFLMPTNQASLAWEGVNEALSTGQQMISSLQEVVSIEDVKYILLDEWDANLDQDNATGIDVVLDELASTKVIVEVRHMRGQQ